MSSSSSLSIPLCVSFFAPFIPGEFWEQTNFYFSIFGAIKICAQVLLKGTSAFSLPSSNSSSGTIQFAPKNCFVCVHVCSLIGNGEKGATESEIYFRSFQLICELAFLTQAHIHTCTIVVEKFAVSEINKWQYYRNIGYSNKYRRDNLIIKFNYLHCSALFLLWSCKILLAKKKQRKKMSSEETTCSFGRKILQ